MGNTQKLLEKLGVVYEIAHDVQDGVATGQLNELRHKLEENNFYLVVSGLFKRGKSSIINTLIGKPVAPVAVTPVTAIITLFEYSEREHTVVIYDDGRKEEIPPDELYRYVTEEENPENEKQISQVNVYGSSPLLKKCSIADTPGIGSVFEHNSETAYSYIPKIDAALFILSADIPVSKTDADFLREIHATAPRIIYVLNKADLLPQQELEKIARFNARVIADITGEDEKQVQLIPVSCKIAEQNYGKSNFQKIEDEIEQLISEQKGEIILQTGQNRLRRIAVDLSQFLKVKADTLRMPVKEIEQKQQSLSGSVKVMQDTRQEFEILLKGQLDTIIKHHFDEAKTNLREMKSRLKDDVPSKFDNHTAVGNIALKQLSDEYTELIIGRMTSMKEETEKRIIEDFNALLEKYQNRSQTYLNEFAKMLEQLFGVSFEILAEKFDLKVYSSFYFLKEIEGQTVEPKLPGYYSFLPEKLRMRKAKTILKNNIEHLIEVNKGRMLPDIRYKVTESFRQFKSEEEKQAEQVYQRISNLLEEAIHQKTKSAKEIETQLSSLNRKIEMLHNVEQSLDSASH